MRFEVHFGCWGWHGNSCWKPLELPRAWPGSGLARGRQNGLDCTPVLAGALFYQDPGIQGIAQVEGDLGLPGPTINLTTA